MKIPGIRVLLLVQYGLLLAAAACHGEAGQRGEPELPVAAVGTQTVESRRHVVTEEVVGTVRTRSRAVIEAKVSGRIASMPITLGQRCSAGDLLVQLDVREIQAKLDQALALREQAGRDLERYRTLLNRQAVTQQELDAVLARQRVAEASVVEAQTMLGYARVTAPFAGVITRKFADVGDLAVPGKPLVEIEGLTGFQFVADVPESLVTKVAVGDSLVVRVASLDEALQGTVSEISPSLDPGSRTFPVKIDLAGHERLRAGQFGRAAIPVETTSVVAVPASAVLHRGQLDIVFVVENDRAHLRLVRIGKALGAELEIIGGLSPGERVVVEGASRLRDGQSVRFDS